MHLPFFSKPKKNNLKDEKKEKPVFYPVCPNCLSPQLKIVKEFTSGWLTPTKYYCPNCHYSGGLVLEVDVTLFETKTPKEIRKMFLEEEFEKIDEEEDQEKERFESED